MFVRADQLWLESREHAFPLHVLEFHWHGFEPTLTCFRASENEVVSVTLDSVDFLVGQQRTCVGYFDDDDAYVPCQDGAQVTSFSQCAKCSGESFIPFQECVFDPKCEGNSEECSQEFCSRPHVLYLAFYDTMAKIGMSSSRRVDRRLIEQGADAFALVGTFPNRFRAREMEKAIAKALRLPQGIRQQTLLNNLSKPLDLDGMGARYEALKEALSDSFSLDAGPLNHLRDYPIDLPLPRTPLLQETHGRHRGELLGVKGKWLLYDADGVKALNLQDTVSRRLARGSE